jgi:hypothetical protein
MGGRGGRARADRALHPAHACAQVGVSERPDGGGSLLQVRELPGAGRLQGARGLERGLRAVGRAGKARRGDAFVGKPRAVAGLCGGTAGHSLHGRDAAHRAAGQEGPGALLRRHDRGVRAVDLVARGHLRPGRRGDRRRVRPPLQRPARDRGAGDVLEGVHRAGRRPRRGDRADRGRRAGVGHLPVAVARRARCEDLRGRTGAGRRRLPVVQGGPHHRRRRARDDRRRAEGAAQGADLAFRVEPRDGHPHLFGGGDRRRDETDLEAAQGRDGAVLRAAAGDDPEEPGRLRAASAWASSSPAAMSISTSCPGSRAEEDR